MKKLAVLLFFTIAIKTPYGDAQNNSTNHNISHSSSTDKTNSEHPSKLVHINHSANDPNVIDEFYLYSKLDFVPGEKVVFFDDFYQDSLGAFPSKWHTYGTGELTRFHKAQKWFKLNSGSAYVPEVANHLPEEYTIQFDLIVDPNISVTSSLGSVFFSILSSEGGNGLEMDGNAGGTIELQMSPSGRTVMTAKNWSLAQPEKLVAHGSDNVFHDKFRKPVNISLSVVKRRFRMYIDNKKVFDLPQFVPQGVLFDKFRIISKHLHEKDKCNVYVSNFRFATSIPNIRSILTNKGHLVTTGLLFDPASDKIKHISYGTLRAIAEVLKENPQLRVKVIGHTDDHGDEKANLLLSKKRAEAVKHMMVKYYHIDPSRIQTDGKGETIPLSSNDTPEGRANNRRVEFIRF